MISGKTQVAATVAVLALSLGSASAAPTFDNDMELATRSGIGSKVVNIGSRLGKDIAQSVGTGELHKKINNHINPPKPVDPRLAAAARHATQGHSHSTVNAALGHLKKHHKRDLDFDEELAARSIGSKISRAGVNLAKEYAQNVGSSELHKKINSHINPPPHIPSGLVNAAKMATKHHDPKLVAAAIGHTRKHHKRDIEFEDDLFERDLDLEDELDLRSIGSKISRVGGNLAKEYAQNVGSSELHKKVNSYVHPHPHIPSGLVDAAKMATKHHDPKLVSAAIAHTHMKKHKKRELDELVDLLVARAMELEIDDLD